MAGILPHRGFLFTRSVVLIETVGFWLKTTSIARSLHLAASGSTCSSASNLR